MRGINTSKLYSGEKGQWEDKGETDDKKEKKELGDNI